MSKKLQARHFLEKLVITEVAQRFGQRDHLLRRWMGTLRNQRGFSLDSGGGQPKGEQALRTKSERRVLRDGTSAG